MIILPENIFKLAPEYAGLYSKFNADGVHIHLVKDGAELTKSAMKKLTKEKEKHTNRRDNKRVRYY